MADTTVAFNFILLFSVLLQSPVLVLYQLVKVPVPGTVPKTTVLASTPLHEDHALSSRYYYRSQKCWYSVLRTHFMLIITSQFVAKLRCGEIGRDVLFPPCSDWHQRISWTHLVACYKTKLSIYQAIGELQMDSLQVESMARIGCDLLVIFLTSNKLETA